MNVLQLTDIHLNSQYDAEFPAMEHLEKVIAETRRDPEFYDAVVLTGDIVDEGSYEQYASMLARLQSEYGETTPILVTPGNHDNRSTLDDVYRDFIRGKSWANETKRFGHYGSFKKPGSAVTVYHLGHIDCSLVMLDTAHWQFPYEGLCRIMQLRSKTGNDDPSCRHYIAFTHMPIIRPFHRFMNQPGYTIPDDGNMFLSTLASAGCNAIACGHYHCESYRKAFGIEQFVAPAIQGQIDPFSEKCNPSGNYPGYAIIGNHGSASGNIEYSVKYVVPSEVEEKEK